MTASKDLPPMKSGMVGTFVKNQFRTKLPRTPKGTDLSSQCAIVTGASSGLGFESGKQMLALGLSHLVIAVRSLDRGQTAASKLQAVNPEAKIEVWLLEMESYESVQEFIRRCEAELPQIDIVILNAGIAEMDFSVVPSTGHEKMMQVNYYSTMLLTVLLLPILKAKSSDGTAPRITVVSSMMASFSSFPNRNKRPLLPSFDNIKAAKWDPVERYNSTKLLGQFFLARLTDCVTSGDVTINMVEPGLTSTSLFRKSRGITGAIFDFMMSTSARPVDVGALTYIDAAVVKGRESHGCFLVNCEIAP